MANYLPCLLLVRVVLPVCLGSCIIIRQNGFSFLYLIFFFISPWIRVPTMKTMKGFTGVYLHIVMTFCVINCAVIIAFQIILYALGPYGRFLTFCDPNERLLRSIGLMRLDRMHAIDIMVALEPEPVMFVTSILVYVLSKRWANEKVPSPVPVAVPELSSSAVFSLMPELLTRWHYKFLFEFGKYVVVLSLCIAAVIRPSIPGGIYFFVFLGSMTWWAFYNRLDATFGAIIIALAGVVMMHIVALFGMQMQWLQEMTTEDCRICRYFGLTTLITTKCSDPRVNIYTEAEWPSYINPGILLWLYFILCLEGRLLWAANTQLDPVSLPLYGSALQTGTTGQRNKPVGILRLSTKRIILRESKQQSVQPDNISRKSTRSVKFSDVTGHTLPDDGRNESEGLPVRFLCQPYFVLSNFTMMAWSITYHSWLTFVLLLWACILWMIPNKCQAMFHSAPILVLYAECLLIIQYIYGMDFTEEELPTNVEGVNLEQLGIDRPDSLPSLPLAVKSFYTLMFWATMRHFMREKAERQRGEIKEDTSLVVQTIGHKIFNATRRTIKKTARHTKAFLTKYWIWVVVISIFVAGVRRKEMNFFGVAYLCIFLILILTLQVSYIVWRNILYGIWLLIIAYSLSILLLIYAYQFDNFENYWLKFQISYEIQQTLGLQKYSTGDLFINLLEPALISVITIIQIHYFHNGFMALSYIQRRSTYNALINQEDEKSQRSTVKISPEQNASDSKGSSLRIHRFMQKCISFWNNAVEFLWMFIEVHSAKILFLSIVILCVCDVCAFHLILTMLITFGALFGRRMHIIIIYAASVLVSFMFLVLMLYQIEYINRDIYNFTCDGNQTDEGYVINENDADWVGLHKIEGESYSYATRGYIGVMVVATLLAVIKNRQRHNRQRLRLPTDTPPVMFPDITRPDADRNLTTCIKYLFNYGFYKFGIEICLIATAILIGARMDMFAILYSFWLLILFPMKRTHLKKIWRFYLVFLIIIIPFQYSFAVGLPPGICEEYPWSDVGIPLHVQAWLFLPPSNPPVFHYLIYDFGVFMLVCCQTKVFHIEEKYGADYPGGSNSDITEDVEDPKYVNPVPDFLDHIRSWLDVFKRGLLSLMWLTLALVFLAGTFRTSIFSAGYLIGSFVFLWEGEEFYLFSRKRIISWWNVLLSYTVMVIVIKTCLQIVACLYLDEVKQYTCWAAQLLGVECMRMFRQRIVRSVRIGDSDVCYVNPKDASLTWDLICFCFLLLIRRHFQSHYFSRTVDDAKARTILASRGAELIEELRLRQIKEQQTKENETLKLIKLKMERLKDAHQKAQGGHVKEFKSHYDAVRSGDYYMFDKYDDDLLEVEKKTTSMSEDDTQPSDRMTVSKLLSTAMQSDLEEAVDRTRKSDDSKRAADAAKVISKPPKGQAPKGTEAEYQPRKRKSCLHSLVTWIKFIWAFIESVMESLTVCLNRLSRDYRYVVKVLSVEKRKLKEHGGIAGGRRNSSMVWQPPVSAKFSHTNPRGADAEEKEKPTSNENEEDIEDLDVSEQPTIVRLLHALWFIIFSHSELLCYLLVFLNQMKSATIISLPLPLMVLFWGTLSVPRPTTTFWITLIAYTQVIVVIKCLFQFDILPWNQLIGSDSPFYPPRILGIEQRENYALYDLVLLLFLFMHRYTLKSLGLWSTSYVDHATYDEEEEFYKLGYTVFPNISKEKLSLIAPIVDKDGKNQSQTPVKLGYKRSITRIPSELLSKDTDSARKASSQKTLVVVKREEEDICTLCPRTIPLKAGKYFESIQTFFEELLSYKPKVTMDMYAYMFLCDFFNFLVVIFGFQSFGADESDKGVAAYFEENRIPILFLTMLLMHFLLMLIDRALYLRKSVLGKIILQMFLVIVVHVWMFFILPLVTDRSFTARVTPQIWYMVKCFYLLFSAYQIRNGYPTRIIGNFLCSKYNIINMVCFQVFKVIPFLFEIRALMDWVWTDTALVLTEWFKMEDIFANIFIIKCFRKYESRYPSARGSKRSQRTKYLIGGGFLLVIIAVMWFPLVLFSLGSSVGVPNGPYDAQLSMRIDSYPEIYIARNTSIIRFTRSQWHQMTMAYAKQKTPLAFFSRYEYVDIAAMWFPQESATMWSITPPDMENLKNTLNSSYPVTFTLTLTAYRQGSNPTTPDISQLSETHTIDDGDFRKNLLIMLSNDDTKEKLVLPNILPKFIQFTSPMKVTPISLLMEGNEKEQTSRNLSINYQSQMFNDTPFQSWWKLTEECNDEIYRNYLLKLPKGNCDYLVIYTFSDRNFPAVLKFISGAGIIGIYGGAVLVISRIVRGLSAGFQNKIMFTELPYVDRVLQLCLDIYLVRESGDLVLEEDLYAKLIFLYRSPETMIKWTRPREESLENQ